MTMHEIRDGRSALRWGRALGTALLLAVAAVPADAADVVDVLARVRKATEPGRDMRAKFTFDITNAKGEVVQWAGMYYRRSGLDARMRLVFDSPLDLRGTEVSISRGADGIAHTRIYLPGIRRVRDIQADMRGESFLGTDFNYEDIGLQQLEFQQHALVGDGEVEGQDCLRVESVPDRGWWYGKVVRCVSKKNFLPLRTEYYDRSGELWKVRSLGEVKTIDSFPTATQITMQTVPVRTSTRITLTDVVYNEGLPDGIFETP
jgi:hypothetical protein